MSHLAEMREALRAAGCTCSNAPDDPVMCDACVARNITESARAFIQQQEDYEAMRQARQDARDVVRWRVATLKSMVERDWSWMVRQPGEVKDLLRRCVSDIVANLDEAMRDL